MCHQKKSPTSPEIFPPWGTLLSERPAKNAILVGNEWVKERSPYNNNTLAESYQNDSPELLKVSVIKGAFLRCCCFEQLVTNPLVACVSLFINQPQKATRRNGAAAGYSIRASVTAATVIASTASTAASWSNGCSVVVGFSAAFVAVATTTKTKRRSTGWKPAHLLLLTRNSSVCPMYTAGLSYWGAVSFFGNSSSTRTRYNLPILSLPKSPPAPAGTLSPAQKMSYFWNGFFTNQNRYDLTKVACI